MKWLKQLKVIFAVVGMVVAVACFCGSSYFWRTVIWVAGANCKAIVPHPAGAAWRLQGLVWESNDVRVVIQEAQVPYLSRYLSAFWSASGPAVVTIEQAKLTIKPALIEQPADPGFSFNLFNLFQNCFRVDHLLSWALPTVVLNNSTIAEGELQVPLSRAIWSRPLIEVSGTLPKLKADFHLAAEIKTPDKAIIAFKVPELDVGLQGNIRLETDNLYLNGAIQLIDSQVNFAGLFLATQSLPKKGWIKAESFKVPTQWLGALGEHLTPLVDFKFFWKDNRYDFALDGKPEVVSKDVATAVDARIHGSGDLTTLKLNAFYLKAPWLWLMLEDPLTIHWHSLSKLFDFKLKVVVDFSRQPWLPIEGTLNGSAVVEASNTWIPSVQLNLDSNTIKVFGLAVESLPLEAFIRWPQVQVDKVLIKFEDESFLRASLMANLEHKRINQSLLEVKLAETLLSHVCPSFLKIREITSSSRLEGSWQGGIKGIESQHAVFIKTLSTPLLKDCDLIVTLKGSGLTFPTIGLEGQFPQGTAYLGGEALFGKEINVMHFSQGGLTYGNTKNLALTRPFSLTLLPREAGIGILSKGMSCKLTPMHFETGEVKLIADATYESHAQAIFNLWLERLDNELISVLFKTPPFVKDIDIYELYFSYQKQEEACKLTSRGLVSTTLIPWGDFIADYSMQSDPRGTLLSLSTTQAGSPVFNLKGQIPVGLAADKGLEWTFLKAGDLQLDCSLMSNPSFCAIVKDVTGLAFTDPAATLKADNQHGRYKGTLDLTAKAFRYERGPEYLKRLPPLNDIEVNILLTDEGLDFSKLQALWAGKPIWAKAEWPVPLEAWAQSVSKKQLPDWSRATGSLWMKEIPLQAFKEVLPHPLKPTGTVSLKALLKENKVAYGLLSIKDCYTFPVSPVGSLQKINIDLVLDKEAIEIKHFDALLNQKPIYLTGRVVHQLKSLDQFKYDLKLKSQEVLLGRLPGTRIKGVVDLALQTDANDQTALTGKIHLTEGFAQLAIIDLQGGANFPDAAPPFFSIDAKPFDQWGVNLTVEGEKFMKIRSAPFDATASVNFLLNGTLKDPIPTGGITFQSALIKFPFANFRSERCTVNLLETPPYTPMLYVDGNTRLYGYELKLTARGAASAPALDFRSSPSLDSSQVISMITTGSSPELDYSKSSLSRLGNLGLFIGKGLLGGLGNDSNISQKLDLMMASDALETDEEGFNLGYKLNNRMTVKAAYDAGEFNWDILWKLYSK